MLKDNEITMPLGEYLNMRDKISEYNRVIGEIVRMCGKEGKIVLTDDLLNTIYDHISDSSIIEAIEAIEAIQDEREKEE